MKKLQYGALAVAAGVALVVWAAWATSPGRIPVASGIVNPGVPVSSGTRATGLLLAQGDPDEEEKKGPKGEDAGKKEEDKKEGEGPKGWDRLWDSPKSG